MTYQGVSIQVFMGRKSGKHEGLLYSLTVGETFVIADRPSVTEDLLRLDTYFFG